MAKDIEPRTFYLNEHHELSREEKPTGGRPSQYAGIDWRREVRTTERFAFGSAQDDCAF